MPFYFSNPRMIVGRAEQRGMRRAEYTRLAPSKFKYTARSPMHHTIRNAFKAQLHVVGALQWTADLQNLPAAINPHKTTTFTMDHKLAMLPPFEFPGIMLSFKTRPTENTIRSIEAVGGSVSGFGRASQQTYLIERGSEQVIQLYLTNADTWDLDERQDAPKGYINACNIVKYVTLLRRLNAVIYSIHAFSRMNSSDLAICGPTPTPATDALDVRVFERRTFPITAPTEELRLQTDAQVTPIYLDNDAGETQQYVLKGRTRYFQQKTWKSNLQEHPEHYTRGLFARYEPDYTAYDKAIFFNFHTAFPGFFEPGEFRILGSCWEDEIAETDAGRAISHCMLACIIAYQSDKGITPLFTESNRRYHGCVLMGSGIITLPTGDVVPITREQVNAELDAVKTHAKVLTDVMTLLGVTEDRSSITTMRKLRAAGGVTFENLPSTETIAQVKELLPYLEFGGYLTANISTLGRIIPIIADTNLSIPYDLPLHPGYFFTTSRTESILSCFGSQAPTLNTSPVATAETRVSNIVSTAGAVAAPAPYSAHAPTILQTIRVDVAAAAGYWNHVMRTGTAAMNTTSSAGQNARAYSGSEKADLWKLLNEWVGVGVNRRGGGAIPQAPIAPVATDGGPRRRRREDDDDGEDEERYLRRQRTNIL